jgi:hypothetical protein
MTTSTTPYSISLDDSITIDSSALSSTVFTGTPGQVYTVGGMNGTSYTNNSWVTVSNNDLTGATLEVKGDANFEGDIKVKGKSINESLDRIEDRLAILRPNEELEEKWEQLRGLRKMYMELEQEIIEKEKIWKILKK